MNRHAALILVAATLFFLLPGCGTPRGLKIIKAVPSAQAAAVAPEKKVFSRSEPIMVHVYGYGGRQVTLEVWSLAQRRRLWATTGEIPGDRSLKQEGSFVPMGAGAGVTHVRSTKITLVQTDWLVTVPALPAGRYTVKVMTPGEEYRSDLFEVLN